MTEPDFDGRYQLISEPQVAETLVSIRRGIEQFDLGQRIALNGAEELPRDVI